jgi:hypothetical protein
MSAPDPECSRCDGTGLVEVGRKEPHPPTFERCECVLFRDILANVERGLPGLSTRPPIKSSPLMGREATYLWITAGEEFLSHLRHVAIRKPLTWSLKVVSDAELTTAWLASIAIQGKEILDADAYAISTRALTLPDLVVPPDLLVIRMGIKLARNQAAPEVLAEALQIRMHENKPTWIWDEPHHPLNAGHLFWSDGVGRILAPWERVQGLGSEPVQKLRPQAPGRKNTGRKTLRGGT